MREHTHNFTRATATGDHYYCDVPGCRESRRRPPPPARARRTDPKTSHDAAAVSR